MPVIIQYLLKLSVSAAVIYAFYYLVLRRLTFYHLNRWYLTGYTLLCFIIPFININPIANRADEKLPALNYIPMVQNIKNYVPPVLKDATPYSYGIWDAIMLLLVIGSMVMLVKLVIQVLSFIRLKRKAECISDDGTVIYHIDEQIMPFSFGRSIYLNKTLHTESELEEIIMHEYVHVKQMHSADILIAELFCILNWYNPFAWFIRHSIRQNLEFIADDNVVRSGIDRKAYQYHLLKVVGIPQYRLANQFNFSSLKKRIIMMNRSRSAKIHLLKFMFILPLLAVTLMAFRSEVINTVNKIVQKPIFQAAMTNSSIPINVLSVVPTAEPKKQLVIPANKKKRVIRPDSAIKKSMDVTAYFNGEVLKTMEINDSYLVITRNGDRFDTYSNLTSVNVKKGDKIKKGQLLGTVDVDTITGIPKLKYTLYNGAAMVYDADGSDTTKGVYVNGSVKGYGTYSTTARPAIVRSAWSTGSSGGGVAYEVSPAQSYSVSGSKYSGNGTVYAGQVISPADSTSTFTIARNNAVAVTGYAIYRDNPDDELTYTIDPRHIQERQFADIEKRFADKGFKLMINNHQKNDNEDKLSIQISGSKNNNSSSASASFSSDDLHKSKSYIKITGDEKTGLVSISTIPSGK